MAENGVIGRNGALPWRIKSDLQYFRKITLNKPVVMGRKTYLSIGKPLQHRTNIVVSRDHGFFAEGVLIAPNLAYAFDAARGDALRRNAGAIAVIGGTEIFEQTMSFATRLIVTLVHANPEGDTYFPAIDPQLWQQVERRSQVKGPDDDYGVSFVGYERKGAA
jgi:dihydrofolate reductase